MNLSRITKEAVLLAIKEYDKLGQETFLKKYGYEKSRIYFLEKDGNSYDSKAIVGVAYKHVDANRRPLKPGNFSGGDKTIAGLLRRLGFEIKKIDQVSKPWSDAENRMVVSSYLDMLKIEMEGGKYSKAQQRKTLRTKLNNRDNGAIEYKYQNISAVLKSLGLTYIQGYKPLPHAQARLAEIVNEALNESKELRSQLASETRKDSVGSATHIEAPSIEKRASRLTWNTNGWIYPSGRDGKSKSKGCHEGKYGYGHEEWLFDIDKLIDGYHYGFLEPIRKYQDTFQKRTYAVWLYTIDGSTKKRYWVGEIQDVEVIDTDTAKEIVKIYKNKGWLQEMFNDIKNSGADGKTFFDWTGVDLFNVRFRPENIRNNVPYYEIPKKHPVYKQSRYAFVHYDESFQVQPQYETTLLFVEDKSSGNKETSSSHNPTKHEREAKVVEVRHLHQTISDGLVKQLRQKFGRKNVTPEHPARNTGGKIDIVVRHRDDEFTFYEIKTYNSASTNIREAIGQLLEYAYWPDVKKSKELIIVSQKLSNENDAAIYMKYLRDTLKIPLYYQWYDIATKELSDKF